MKNFRSNISVIKQKPQALTIYSKSAEEVVPFQILPDRSNDRCKYFGREIKKFYFGLTEPSLANVNAYIAVSFFLLFKWDGIAVKDVPLICSSYSDDGR